MKRRTVAIIQARMGSNRLPGKVMMPLGRRSVLAYLIERISSARNLDSIVVATTTHLRDDIVIEEAIRCGASYFRGDEVDVLGRYVDAAQAFNAEIVVRVTADNPFTDPESIDRTVSALSAGKADYAIEMALPIGVTGEAITAEALFKIDSVAKTPRWREHVTLYAKETPEALRCAFLPVPSNCARHDLSFTIDERHEYLRAQELAEKLVHPHFSLMDLIGVADEIGSQRLKSAVV